MQNCENASVQVFGVADASMCPCRPESENAQHSETRSAQWPLFPGHSRSITPPMSCCKICPVATIHTMTCVFISWHWQHLSQKAWHLQNCENASIQLLAVADASMCPCGPTTSENTQHSETRFLQWPIILGHSRSTTIPCHAAKCAQWRHFSSKTCIFFS